MPPIYFAKVDEWCYISTDACNSSMSAEMLILIDDFENQMKTAKTLKTRDFTVTIKDTLWHVSVIPVSEDEKGHLGVFIHNNKKDLTVKCKIIIGDGLVDELDDGKIEAKMGWGVFKLLAHQDCKDMLSDGSLKIKLEIKVIEENITLIHGNPFYPIPDASCMNLKIYEDKACADFRFDCNGKSFPCHKVFLIARSSVFKSMIDSNMKEATEGRIEFENYEETVAESFVKFFYTGQVDEDILKENVVSFLDLGEKYDLAGLKAIAEQVMIANLDKKNMLSFFLAGNMYRGEMIRPVAKSFLRENRRSLVKQEGWKDALRDNDLVFELLEFFSED